ncbi:MAG: hypothetical protein QG670_2084, partial [Thermoproteota archaeon]|nr:hypothetical protein [Thermoproteota archaeon]
NEYVWFDCFEKNVPAIGPLEFGQLKVGLNQDLEFTGWYIENTEGIGGSDAKHLNDGSGGGSVYMNIADSVLTARQYADERRTDDDSIGKVAVEYPDDNFDSHYNPCFNHICLQKANGFIDGVIIHEFGHHLEFQISRIALPSPWDWAHNWDSDKYPAFAWFDGFPAYLGNIIVVRKNNEKGYNDPLYVGPPRFIRSLEMESPNCGDFSIDKESTVAALLWDLADNPNDAMFSRSGSTFPRVSRDENSFDNVAYMEQVIFRIFDSDVQTLPILWYPPSSLIEIVQPNLDNFADFMRVIAPSPELESLLNYYRV